MNDPECRARPLSSSRSTTCSSAGTGSPALSTTAGSASRTMRPSARFADLHLAESHVLFAGSERDADRAAAMTTLIMTAKLNDVDPQACLAGVLGQIADIPQGRLA